ncbi:peptide deformylase [Pigmentibacter sp. JX0631]|uniref:peptide deformylase n=1 Tax=Pigmentibacter sp. JX0631 TaxID=2976982 RepID=UPI002469345F|nr:peptide deformylase [Pigmentibacter sp. JX0631]WGL60611.1 peptide deformylase [Pigmentibacter sp. JX0631]
MKKVLNFLACFGILISTQSCGKKESTNSRNNSDQQNNYATLSENFSNINKSTITKPSLPEYVMYDLKNQTKPKVLRTKAKKLEFPLSTNDRKDIKILVEKFDNEKNIAGLAAPQIGIGKQIIVFALEPTEELKKWRKDIEDTMSKTVWINPSYKGVGTEKILDFEGCFSVNDITGKVSRFKTIEYTAYLENGDKVTGRVSGFLARIIQHEIDHLNKTGIIDLIPKDQWIILSEYLKARTQKIEKNEEIRQ